MNKKTKDKYDDVQALVDKCDRCGACTMVCPLFDVNPIDRATARGKIALTRAFLEGKLPGGSRALREALDYCLLCKACTDVCPSKIMTDEAMISIREILSEEEGLPLKYRLIGYGMGSNTLRRLGQPVVNLAQQFQIPRYTGGLLPVNNRFHQVQSQADNPLSDYAHKGPAQFSPLHPSAHRDLSQVKRIAYYQGCAMKLFFTEASKATMRLLKSTGKEVYVPSVDCCGMPQISHGMEDKALSMAKANIDRLQDADLIVTDCGSCGSMLKEYALRLHDDAAYRDKAKAFSQKVIGLTEYLYALDYEPEKKTDLKVAYHASCHLNRAQGIDGEPRALLKKAVNYVDSANSTTCCGGSGTFQIDFPDTANKILEQKYQGFKAADADIVVTECPSCMMQLNKMEQKGDIKVLHISQVL